MQRSSSVTLGGIVLISEERVTRRHWPMGRVIAVHPGKDGLLRTVALRTQKGNLRRPTQRIYNLEVQEEVCPSASHDISTIVKALKEEAVMSKD